MPFHTITTPDGLEVESELLTIPIKVYDSPKRRNRLFSCCIIHAGSKQARIICGEGRLSLAVKLAIKHYLQQTGFTRFTFERGDPTTGQRIINGGLIE